MLKNITTLQWIGIIILFNTTLLGGASQLADLALSVVAVKAILAAATLGNGFLGGLVTMFGGQGNMVSTVAAMPGVTRITVNEQASAALATVATDPAQMKVGPASPDVRPTLVATAKAG